MPGESPPEVSTPIFLILFGIFTLFSNASFARDPAKIKDGVLVSTSNNMTLYVFDKDLEGNGKSECNDQCAKNWPPFSLTEKEKSHGHGKFKVIKGKKLLESLTKLVHKYEQNSKNPISVEKMSSKTLKQVNGIVGFSIKINEIQAAYKLSQNRNKTDYENIKYELNKIGDFNSIEIANEMKKVKK